MMFSYDWALVGLGSFILLVSLMCLCRMWRIRRSYRENTACRTMKYTKHRTSNDSCSICLEDFKRKEIITVCPCKHGFHKKCLSEWLKQNNTCPVCKTDVMLSGERRFLVNLT